METWKIAQVMRVQANGATFIDEAYKNMRVIVSTSMDISQQLERLFETKLESVTGSLVTLPSGHVRIYSCREAGNEIAALMVTLVTERTET